MHQRLGILSAVPLQVATQTRVIVENAEQLRFDPVPCLLEDTARALMKVQMPKPERIVRFIASDLQCLQTSDSLARAGRVLTRLALLHQPSSTEVALECRVGRDRAEGAVQFAHSDKVVMMQLHREPGILGIQRVDYRNGSGTENPFMARICPPLATQCRHGIG